MRKLLTTVSLVSLLAGCANPSLVRVESSDGHSVYLGDSGIADASGGPRLKVFGQFDREGRFIPEAQASGDGAAQVITASAVNGAVGLAAFGGLLRPSVSNTNTTVSGSSASTGSVGGSSVTATAAGGAGGRGGVGGTSTASSVSHGGSATARGGNATGGTAKASANPNVRVSSTNTNVNANSNTARSSSSSNAGATAVSGSSSTASAPDPSGGGNKGGNGGGW